MLVTSHSCWLSRVPFWRENNSLGRTGKRSSPAELLWARTVSCQANLMKNQLLMRPKDVFTHLWPLDLADYFMSQIRITSEPRRCLCRLCSTPSTWIFAHTCLRQMENPSITPYTPSWCTVGSPAMEDTISATQRSRATSFLSNGEKCGLGKINFPISVTDSQGFGAEGLLRGWAGFVLTYSLFGSFLPVFLERKHAEIVAFFFTGQRRPVVPDG